MLQSKLNSNPFNGDNKILTVYMQLTITKHEIKCLKGDNLHLNLHKTQGKIASQNQFSPSSFPSSQTNTTPLHYSS